MGWKIVFFLTFVVEFYVDLLRVSEFHILYESAGFLVPTIVGSIRDSLSHENNKRIILKKKNNNK